MSARIEARKWDSCVFCHDWCVHLNSSSSHQVVGGSALALSNTATANNGGMTVILLVVLIIASCIVNMYNEVNCTTYEQHKNNQMKQFVVSVNQTLKYLLARAMIG